MPNKDFEATGKKNLQSEKKSVKELYIKMFVIL